MILQTNKNRAHNTTHGSLNKMLPFGCVTDKHIIRIYYIYYNNVICVMSFVGH